MTTHVRFAPDGGARLFVSVGLDPTDPTIQTIRRYVLARSRRLARLLEPDAEVATDADVRAFLESVVREKTTPEACADLGVSRQTLHHWRKRAARLP